MYNWKEFHTNSQELQKIVPGGACDETVPQATTLELFHYYNQKESLHA